MGIKTIYLPTGRGFIDDSFIEIVGSWDRDSKVSKIEIDTGFIRQSILMETIICNYSQSLNIEFEKSTPYFTRRLH